VVVFGNARQCKRNH